MDAVTQHKWDKAAAGYDFFNARGPDRRWAPLKQEFFAPMRGHVLFLAVGTGLDIRFFPSHQTITGIDISPKMLEKAKLRAEQYNGRIELRQMDARQLNFPGNTFDQAFTACTFCSIPDPVRGLREVHRVLKPGGELHMFEHTGSRWFPFRWMLELMNPVARRFGPELTRDTPANVVKAGFHIRSVRNIYLDVVKIISAEKQLAQTKGDS